MQREKYLRYRSLEGYASLKHLVTLRVPSSPLEYSMALHTGQEEETIHHNREELREYFGKESCFISACQVHGARVEVIEQARERGWSALDRSFHADALLSDLPGVVLTILTADCVPILLYDPEHQAVGAVHAGWKGSRKEIVAKTVGKMKVRYGSDPVQIRAAIGPAIGGCCYEVSPEVAEDFEGIEGAVDLHRGERPYLDLKKVNRYQLLEAGLREEHIETTPHCTACEHERFFSYRKEGGCAGRFMSCIMLLDRR